MKSRLAGFIALFLCLSLLMVPAVLANNPGVTRVRGNVYDQDNGGAGIGGLTVNVTCNGNSRNATTDGNGLYVVDYTRSECPQFGPVSSAVSHNGQSQSDTVYVSDVYTATMDFYFGTISVPEFGMIPGAIAAIGSIGTYLALRRKRT
ncbi:MAG: hypothetical protein WC775_02215 [Patescibacteria group bacterium]